MMQIRKLGLPRLWLRLFLVCFVVLVFLHIWRSLSLSQQESAQEAFFAQLPLNASALLPIDEEECNCSRAPSLYNATVPVTASSSCDAYATARGPHQRVVSYAFYGSMSNVFAKGIEENAKKVALIYPGWTMRVYLSVDTNLTVERQMLCTLWCQYSHLDFCQVGRLPPPLNDQSKVNGMVWRFLVLGDELVERFLVRDLDSFPSQREADAVLDWIASNLTWHFMHDHPSHTAMVMGGMWGGMNRNLMLACELRQKLLKDGRRYFMKGHDQDILARHLWSHAKLAKDYVRHNSYLCKQIRESVPFPSRRHNLEFVGSPILLANDSRLPNVPCPPVCRPRSHQDWTYC